jgi:hypothetical protein
MEDLYAVTKEERASYEQFCKHAFEQMAPGVPETVWYYTTGSTFGRIIKSNQIWGTQISCVNDHTEFRYAVKLFGDIVKTFKEAENIEDAEWLRAHILEILTEEAADSSAFFVICASNRRDQLSQWRAYGGGEGGIAIGLRAKDMLKTDTGNLAFMVPVCYSDERQKALVRDVVRWTLRYFSEGLARRPGADKKK